MRHILVILGMSAVFAGVAPVSHVPDMEAQAATIHCTAGVACNGTPYADVMYGTSGPDSINSGGGKDFVYAYQGNDTIRTEGDVDWVSGGDGGDVVWLGPSGDTFIGEPGNDLVHGGDGGDGITGGTGSDNLFGEADADDVRVQDGLNNDSADCGSGAGDIGKVDFIGEHKGGCENLAIATRLAN